MPAKKKYPNKTNNNVRILNNEWIKTFASGDAEMQKSLQLIAEILREEGFEGKMDFSDELAINLDLCECLKSKGRLRDNTVDFVIGVGKNSLVLVEAKFKVNNVENIKKTIFDKIKHSKDLLMSNPCFVNLDEQTIILLKDQFFEEQSNKLQRLLIAKTRMIKPLRTSDLYRIYVE